MQLNFIMNTLEYPQVSILRNIKLIKYSHHQNAGAGSRALMVTRSATHIMRNRQKTERFVTCQNIVSGNA